MHLVGFIVRIYHNARPPECQIQQWTLVLHKMWDISRIAEELWVILGFCSSVAEDCVLLGYVAASLGNHIWLCSDVSQKKRILNWRTTSFSTKTQSAIEGITCIQGITITGFSQLLYVYRARNKITQLSIPTHAQLQRHWLKFIKNHLKNSYTFRSSTIFRELQCPR